MELLLSSHGFVPFPSPSHEQARQYQTREHNLLPRFPNSTLPLPSHLPPVLTTPGKQTAATTAIETTRATTTVTVTASARTESTTDTATTTEIATGSRTTATTQMATPRTGARLGEATARREVPAGGTNTIRRVPWGGRGGLGGSGMVLGREDERGVSRLLGYGCGAAQGLRSSEA